jgi:hypothetical protein
VSASGRRAFCHCFRTVVDVSRAPKRRRSGRSPAKWRMPWVRREAAAAHVLGVAVLAVAHGAIFVRLAGKAPARLRPGARRWRPASCCRSCVAYHSGFSAVNHARGAARGCRFARRTSRPGSPPTRIHVIGNSVVLVSCATVGLPAGPPRRQPAALAAHDVGGSARVVGAIVIGTGSMRVGANAKGDRGARRAYGSMRVAPRSSVRSISAVRDRVRHGGSVL